MSLDHKFPRLTSTNHRVTSPRTTGYNCVAFAAGDDTRWWWPVGALGGYYYWPPGVTKAETQEAFREAFESLGYELCDSGALEVGYEKVAIYASPAGVPTHGARQVATGRWVSKLGQIEDIEHETPEAVGGSAYGEVAFFMRRATAIETDEPESAESGTES
jgi:hypothetical protein